jgi:hypothetical protein
MTHQNTPLFFAIWWQKWAFDPKTKACDHLIFMILSVFDIEFSGDQGSQIEHLAAILRGIREIYKKK